MIAGRAFVLMKDIPLYTVSIFGEAGAYFGEKAVGMIALTTGISSLYTDYENVYTVCLVGGRLVEIDIFDLEDFSKEIRL